MPYQSQFNDIVYPDEPGSPCVLQYRIAFTKPPQPLVVVQLVHTDPSFASPVASSIVRDHLLNRILDDRLKGVPVNAICLAVTDASDTFEYEIEVDVDDYIRRGHPYEGSQVTTGGSRVRERISIKSEHIVAGRTRVQTVHAQAAPLSPAVADALA